MERFLTDREVPSRGRGKGRASRVDGEGTSQEKRF